jgi:hypothetical protein
MIYLLMPFIWIAGMIIGNSAGDRATFKDCATTGQAKLLGSGTIICEVKKEQPK